MSIYGQDWVGVAYVVRYRGRGRPHLYLTSPAACFEFNRPTSKIERAFGFTSPEMAARSAAKLPRLPRYRNLGPAQVVTFERRQPTRG